jgi:dipeptidyl-peptidase-4
MMMKKILTILSIVLIATFGFSQKKELNLKDAVLGQFRTFAPDQTPGFQWIPASYAYTFYSKNYQTMFRSSLKAKEDSEVLTIQEMNQFVGSEIPNFFTLKWITSKDFVIDDGSNFYSVDINVKKGKLLLKIPEHVENVLPNGSYTMALGTIGNNVVLVEANGKINKVTNEMDAGIVSGQSIARNEFGISGGLFWSNKGELVAFYQKDERAVHDYPLLDINTTPGALQNIKYPMAGQFSEKPKLGVYSVKKGSVIYIQPQGSEDDYLTNVVFSSDDQYVLIAEVNRDQNHMKLNLYDANTGSFVRTLIEEKNDKWVEPEHPAYFLPGKNKEFIWISERDGFNNLYHYDINGMLIKQLTNNTFVTKGISWCEQDGTSLIMEATGPDARNNWFYRVDLNGNQQLLTPSEGVHNLLVCSDGKFAFDAFSNVNIDHKSFIIDNKGKQVKVLKESEDKLGEYAIGSMELGTVSANDGSVLYSRLIRPSNFDPNKKYPVLVYVYGGPHAQMVTNSWLGGANLWMYWMAEKGYLVYTVDGRGSAERGFAFESQIHRQLGKVEMEDQIAGVNYLKSLSFVDSNRIAIHGWSFGGFMTTSLLLHHPDVFKVGVAGGPVTDWKYYEIMYGERYMDRPEQNPKGYEASSVLNVANQLKGDLLLIHGTVDDVVVMQHNYALVKKFVDLGIQVDFFPYPMHKHNVMGKDRVHLMEKVLTYILENNQ